MSENLTELCSSSEIRKLLKAELRKKPGGILPPNGNSSSRRTGLFVLSILLRDHDFSMPGTRSLNIGRKELLLEISPGQNPPSFLQGRSIKGAQVDEKYQEALAQIFLDVKDEGFFEADNFAGALRHIVQRLTHYVISDLPTEVLDTSHLEERVIAH